MSSKKDVYRQAHYRIDFGLNRADQVVQTETPELTQYDNNSGLFVFDFYNDGRRLKIDDCRIFVSFILPNGDKVSDEVEEIRTIESRALYYTPSGILTQQGLVHGNISLYKDGVQITSPVKFAFAVVESIDTSDFVEHDSYPMLTKLILKVDELVDNLEQWDGKFNANYDKHDLKFNQKYDSVTEEFNEKSQAIDVRFDDKWNEIDAMFHQGDIDAMFQEKFERLEQDFAQDYSDMKQTVREVYTTTLKYRYVD